MSKLFSFYHNFFNKYVSIKSKTKVAIIFILSISLPIIVPTIFLSSLFPIFPVQIFLIVSIVVWCLTFLPLSLHAVRGMEELDYQKEDKRRNTPPNYLFYRYKNIDTNEWTNWNRIDMNDSYYRNWHKSFIEPLEMTGDAETEWGGETEEEKILRKRNDALENIL